MTLLYEPNAVLAVRLLTVIPDPRIATRREAATGALAKGLESVVVIGPSLPMSLALEYAAEARLARPGVGIVLLRSVIDDDVLARSVRGGVLVVVDANDRTAVANACQRAHPSEVSYRPGQITVVLGSTGGCGKTTVAINLASVLRATGAQVCLVDLSLDTSGLAAQLRLDTVSPLVTPYEPGLDCALTQAKPGELFSPTFVAELLVALEGEYDHVVVDTPTRFTEQVLTALDSARHHIVVGTAERPSLKAMRLALDMLDLLTYDPRGRRIVLNRVVPEVRLSPREVDALVHNRVDGELPATKAVPASINQGVPLAAAIPDHPFAKALRRFTDTSIDHV
ncbi:division plane positioning ATPase MipZ [Kutzneria sp. NPDC051319]|uniref:AAA family ATPase n=1 Tax=Kutzneria sp. NPDC051319 TaxID=3155047 RepID=UPI0034341926